jgi:hypothetical protein
MYLGSLLLELEPSSDLSYAIYQIPSHQTSNDITHSRRINQPETPIPKPINSIIKTTNLLPFPASPW